MNDRTPDQTLRKNRRLAASIVTSVAIHGFFILTILAIAMREGPITIQRFPAADSARLKMVLLPSGIAVAAASPAPVEKTAPATSALPTSMSLKPPSPVPAVASVTAPTGQQAKSGEAAGSEMAMASPATLDAGAGNDYRRRLLEHILPYRRPPVIAAGLPTTGIVMVRFSMARNGDVLTVTVASSSGIAALDDAAIETVWRAKPMPSIPPILPERLSVVLPVSFGPTARFPG